jgi:hypothetical protein
MLGRDIASLSSGPMRTDRCRTISNIDIGLLVSSVEFERETDPHERAGVGSDLYAQLMEGAIRSAKAIPGGIRQGHRSLVLDGLNVL